MNCPMCDSDNVRAVSGVQNQNDNYRRDDDGFCKGLLCGGLSCFLCSSCSAVSGKVTTAILWACENCGRKFKL
jgi:ribosomal protein L37AE/L43A